jgi:hypothetical protein
MLVLNKPHSRRMLETISVNQIHLTQLRCVRPIQSFNQLTNKCWSKRRAASECVCWQHKRTVSSLSNVVYRCKITSTKVQVLGARKLHDQNYMHKYQITAEVIARAQQYIKSLAQAIVWAITCVRSRCTLPALAGLVLLLPQKSHMHQPHNQ